MKRVIKYKLNSILSNTAVIAFTVILLLVMNFSVLKNSQAILSGGRQINIELKYQLMMNNYSIVNMIYVTLFAIFLGAGVIGPDAQSGNVQLILTSFPSRVKYYLGTLSAVAIYLTAIQIILAGNILLLFVIFDVPFLWSDFIVIFCANYLNALVIFIATAFASIYIKGYGAVLVGLGLYAFQSIYLSDVVPFVNASFFVNLTIYKNYIVNFFPWSVSHAPSYTDPEILAAYAVKPIIPNVYVYQSIYVIIITALSTLCFNKRELSN